MEFLDLVTVVGWVVVWVAGSLLAMLGAALGLYIWGQVIFRDVLGVIEAREAYIFYRQYHGQLKQGRLVCPECASRHTGGSEG